MSSHVMSLDISYFTYGLVSMGIKLVSMDT